MDRDCQLIFETYDKKHGQTREEAEENYEKLKHIFQKHNIEITSFGAGRTGGDGYSEDLAKLFGYKGYHPTTGVQLSEKEAVQRWGDVRKGKGHLAGGPVGAVEMSIYLSGDIGYGVQEVAIGAQPARQADNEMISRHAAIKVTDPQWEEKVERFIRDFEQFAEKFIRGHEDATEF